MMAPRLLRPKNERSTPDEIDKSPDLQGGKRRAVSSACIPCRKRKSKCDGALPSCSTCTAVYRTECTYDADSDHRRKGALKRDIQSLQQRNDALDVIVTSLRSLQEDESISLLHSLRSDTSLDELATSLRTNVKLPQNFGHQTLEAEFAEQLSPATSSSRGGNTTFSVSREDSTDDSQLYSGAATPAETSKGWFRTPQDAEFVDHLLRLYFCWIHPFYQFFSQEHFLHDMNRGRSEYCSSLLVNALLSFACHYADGSPGNPDSRNPVTAGDQFFVEARRELESTERPSITTVQALAIMSVRETSRGRDSSGYQYAGRCVRMALELGLHLSVISTALRTADSEDRKLTFWAVFNLETFFSVFVGRLSQLPRAAADVQKPSISDRTESQVWQQYVDSNLSPNQTAEEPSHSMLFFNQLTDLSELASDMANDFYAPRERFTSRRLATTYAKYQEWHQNLPSVFQLENTSLPHVLVLHMYYYGCVLHLFRPYIKLDLRSANLFPHETCTFCANEISGLTHALRDMYGLRRVCLPVTSLLLSASTIHLLNVPAEQSTAHLSQAIRDFQSMSLNHQFAARCIGIIQSLATRWNISLPEEAISSVPPTQSQTSSYSNFWAASIPREVSFKTGGQNYPGYALQEPPFLHAAPPSQQSFFRDPTISPDPTQAQNAFWTPFPSQTMPIPSQNIVPSMSMQAQQTDERGNQWTVVDRPLHGGGGGGIVQAAAGNQQIDPGSAGGIQHSADYHRWHWQ